MIPVLIMYDCARDNYVIEPGICLQVTRPYSGRGVVWKRD